MDHIQVVTVGSVFASSATQHGGQESTILSFHTTLLHQGMVVVGLPYAFAGQMGVSEVTGGSPYGASTLKLGIVHPLPHALIREFADKVERLFVVEELDPFIEDQVKAMGVSVTGKEIFSLCGELTPGRIRSAFADIGIVGAGVLHLQTVAVVEKMPPRPPNMCPGCPGERPAQILGTRS